MLTQGSKPLVACLTVRRRRWKNDVQSDRSCAVSIQQCLHQIRNPMAWPWPWPNAPKAGLVDINDEDSVVEYIGCQNPTRMVGENVLQRFNQLLRAVRPLQQEPQCCDCKESQRTPRQPSG